MLSWVMGPGSQPPWITDEISQSQKNPSRPDAIHEGASRVWKDPVSPSSYIRTLGEAA